jgi:hypothetical protein
MLWRTMRDTHQLGVPQLLHARRAVVVRRDNSAPRKSLISCRAPARAFDEAVSQHPSSSSGAASSGCQHAGFWNNCRRGSRATAVIGRWLPLIYVKVLRSRRRTLPGVENF